VEKMLIDARGFGCPKPVMMAEEALSNINEGLVEILLDNEASVKNVIRFATKNGFYSETVKENNYWNVKIVKGYPCELPTAEEKPVKGTEKELCLIIASDKMGKEEELGKILMKAFFETIMAYKEFPTAIFFLNTGVKLTTLNEEIITILKEFEKNGVEIFSCGTCLKYFNLESELKVGYRGTTNHLLEGIKDFKKTVWIG
jgi:selenium metabolism protein YedF